jgi:RNA polymerase sigma-70 factor (ECF subfamily)
VAASRESFASEHRRLLDQMYGEVRSTSGLTRDALVTALWKSAEKTGVTATGVAGYLRGLRLRDLALAAACAAGSDDAWQTLLKEMRGPLRAAGRAMAGDRGEELADALFGELYTHRESKLGSYGGRSSLAGWLRAVLYQTYVDRLRAEKRLVPLDSSAPGEDPAPAADPPAPEAADPVEQSEYGRMAAVALERALAALPPRQKLLLDFYYFHGLTLREAAALVKVHEATASRELDRARGQLQRELTAILGQEYGLGEEEVRRCLFSAVEGGLELGARAAAPERS